jgi:hypothetical protein
MSSWNVRRLGRMLAAVLVGNAVYFTLLPYLPARIRHQPHTLDLGLVLDFLLCVVAYVGINALLRRPGSRQS